MTTIQKAAIHIAERAKDLCDIQSRAPDSIAGAAIYMACAAAGERKQMKGEFSQFLIFHKSNRSSSFSDVQSVAGVMESTIRQIYKIMLPKAADLFPAEFPFKVLPGNLPQS